MDKILTRSICNAVSDHYSFTINMAATKKDIYSEGSLLKKKKKNIDRRLIDFKFTFVFFMTFCNAFNQ